MNNWQPKPAHIALGVCSAFVLWLILGAVPVLWTGGFEEAGQFGDMFGAANSLFSGLAMVGVVYAVILQTKEIEAQRAEQKENENFRRAQIDGLNASIETTREQLRLMKMSTAPAIQWRSIDPGHMEATHSFQNKGGRMKITAVRVLNSSNVATSFSSRVIGSEEKGSVCFKWEADNAIPPEGLLFELHYNGASGPDFQKFKLATTGSPTEEN